MTNENYVEFKGKKISYGRYIFNKALPEDYELIDEPVDGKVLKNIINDISLKYDSNTVLRTINNIKDLGFHYSTAEGYSLGLNDFSNHGFKKHVKELKDGEIKENMKKMNNPEIQEKLKKLPFSIFIESGARGSWDQAKQLVLCKGHIADSKNQIRPRIIKSSLVEGLSKKDFFESSWGTRKALMNTATSTGLAGYLTRQLIYSTVNIELDYNPCDCGTKDHLKVYIPEDDTGEKLIKSFLWRNVLAKDGNYILITTKNYKEFIGKTLYIRSPIYCKNKKVCTTCYGNLYKLLHSDQIGIVASQAISERITQLVLRVFHLSGIASQKSDSSENKDIISGMNLMNNVFHNPTKLKNIEEPLDMVNMLRDVFGEYGSLHNVHFEIIVSSMMWVSKKPWRTLSYRRQVEPEWVSILQVPNRSSWLLGMAFSNVKKKLLEGLIRDRVDPGSSITDLFKN